MSIPKIGILSISPDKHPDALLDFILYDDITVNETEEDYIKRKAINKENSFMFFFKNKDGIIKLRYRHPYTNNTFKEYVLDVEELPNGTYKMVNLPTIY